MPVLFSPLKQYPKNSRKFQLYRAYSYSYIHTFTRMLLEAGAKAYHTNTVNRTAAAMAAFVGNHHCVSVINNFVPKDDVWYYTRYLPT